MTLHRGKIATEPSVTNVRALTRDDLLLVKDDRGGGADRLGSGVVQRLRDTHRRIARLVAAGLRPWEIVERTGYSYQRISTLQRDPTFMELVARMRVKVDEAFEREQDEYAKLATGNMLKAETMLAEKLEEAEENGEFLPTKDLIAISRDAADRFGYGKRQMNLNVNMDFAAELEKARSRSSKARVIEAAAFSPVRPQSLPAPGAPATVTPEGPAPRAVAGLRRI
jgi:hypothetical protein